MIDLSEWLDATVKIYNKIGDENRKELVFSLESGFLHSDNFLKEYYYKCAFDLIRSEILDIFRGNREQEDFIKIFGDIMKENVVNDFCADIIKDMLTCYNNFDATFLVSHLNEENCTYVFSYLIINYSIYKFRSDWKYINLAVLMTLWEHHGNMSDYSDKVIDKIKKIGYWS